MLTGCGNNTSPQPKAVKKPSTIPLGPVDYLENLGKQRKGMKKQIEGLKAQQRALAEEYEKMLSRPRRRPTTTTPQPDKPEKLEKPAKPDGDSGDADTPDKDAK